MKIGNLKESFFRLTPLGRADLELKESLKEEIGPDKLDKYEKSLNRYRDLRILNDFFRILLYASIITSVATTFGFNQLRIIEQIASYIGTTMLLIFYGITRYFSVVARESYHVQREILISENS